LWSKHIATRFFCINTPGSIETFLCHTAHVTLNASSILVPWVHSALCGASVVTWFTIALLERLASRIKRGYEIMGRDGDDCPARDVYSTSTNLLCQNVMPFATTWEENEKLPQAIYRKAAADGLLMPMASGSSIPKEWADKFPIIGGIVPTQWDGFHDFIIHSELNRIGGIG
jgi:hypothetical protein